MSARQCLAFLISCALPAAAGAARAQDDHPAGRLLVLAAASTREAIDELRANFAGQHPEVTVRASFAASSTLAQQADAGAEADLFLSASSQWADFLEGKDLVALRSDLLSNELVVVVPADSKITIDGAARLADPRIRRLVLADPKAVPAGVYARQALEKLNLWEKLGSKVAGAADVRQALKFVETGAAEAGIVYRSDAQGDKKVRIALALDPKLSQPIRYPLVLLKRGADNKAAVAFYEFLRSPPAAAVFRRYGFIVLSSDAQH